MNRIFIFQEVHTGNIVFIFALLALGYEVHYLTSQPELRPILRWLQRNKRFQAIDFSLCETLNPRFFHDENPLELEGVDEWSRMEPLVRSFICLFPGITDIEAKLYRCLSDQFRDDNLDAGSPLCAWIEGAIPANRPITIITPYRNSFERNVKLPDHELGVITVPSVLPLIKHLYNSIAQPAIRLKQALAKRFSPAPVPDEATQSQTAEQSFRHERYSVLFFPHHGVAYGTLFQKDQFYSPDPMSAFHPTNICHAEFLNDGEPAREPLGSARNPYLMPPITVWFKLRSLAAFMPSVWKAHKQGIDIFGLDQLRYLKEIFKIYSQFQFFRGEIKRFPNVKVALVGYDILFPKALALSFESMAIKTVACEERTIHSCLEASFILDTYLCGSPFFGKLQTYHRVGFARQFVPVGLVRSDLLHRYAKTPLPAEISCRKGDRKLAVVLDYFSAKDPEFNRLSPIVNWRANYAFLEDIIQLSIACPNTFFVIRGKDAQWKHLGYFKDIVARLSECENIYVDEEYDVHHESYILCTSADLVIAKYTSLGVECLSQNIPVLFYDFLHNSNRIFSHKFDFLGSSCMVSNYEQLEIRAKHILLEDANPFKETEAENMKKIFGEYNDGQVVERVLSYIEGLVEAPTAPSTTSDSIKKFSAN